jgi:hypothetical protein
MGVSMKGPNTTLTSPSETGFHVLTAHTFQREIPHKTIQSICLSQQVYEEILCLKG